MATVVAPYRTRKPSTLTMAANFAGAVARTAGRLATGQRVTVPDEVRRQRLAACESCSDYLNREERCGRCGCFLKGQILSKVKLASERCPNGLWPEFNG